MSLPTASEINVHDSLDERNAVANFLGKSLDDAFELFRENQLYYQEDLMFMGPVAFRYYVPAFIRYIRSDDARGDSDAINCFEGLISYWFECHRPEVAPIEPELSDALRYIIDDYAKFEVNADIYGDLRAEIETLRATIRSS